MRSFLNSALVIALKRNEVAQSLDQLRQPLTTIPVSKSELWLRALNMSNSLMWSKHHLEKPEEYF